MPSDSCDLRGATTTTVKPGAPPPEPEHLPCPRCDSTNTKFCYYNNYNFSQPRHFCKACRRYWTHGGTLRDIPVGGGSRKNAKRSRLTTTSQNNTLYHTNSSSSLEFRQMGPTPILLPFAGEHHGGLHFGKPAVSMCESFTSLLNSTQGPGGFEDGRMVWPFSGIGDCGGIGGYYAAVGGGGSMTWQMESGESGGGGGPGGECFTLPDLMI